MLYEVIWLGECPTTFKPVLHRCYVDDTYILFMTQSHIKLFFDYL